MKAFLTFIYLFIFFFVFTERSKKSVSKNGWTCSLHQNKIQQKNLEFNHCWVLMLKCFMFLLLMFLGFMAAGWIYLFFFFSATFSFGYLYDKKLTWKVGQFNLKLLSLAENFLRTLTCLLRTTKKGENERKSH